jgi:uncharacterized protein YlxW (UPF0749 family)
MKFSEDFWGRKIPLSYFGWGIIIATAFMLNMCTSKFHYKRAYESERKAKLKEIKNEIKFREGIIEKYEQEIEYQNKKIVKLNNQVDSLNKLKSKVEIRYKKEIAKVKQMDAKEITNYWDAEFN